MFHPRPDGFLLLAGYLNLSAREPRRLFNPLYFASTTAECDRHRWSIYWFASLTCVRDAADSSGINFMTSRSMRGILGPLVRTV